MTETASRSDKDRLEDARKRFISMRRSLHAAKHAMTEAAEAFGALGEEKMRDRMIVAAAAAEQAATSGGAEPEGENQ